MDGLYFLLSIVAIGLVMGWAARNDRVGLDKPTTGLFAMPAQGRVKLKIRRSPRLVIAPDPGAPDPGAPDRAQPDRTLP